jgi:hypothetical protein
MIFLSKNKDEVVLNFRVPKARAAIRDLPQSASVFANKNGRGGHYWRVQLGKRFIGGKRITRDFDSLQEAKRWIFGDAQKSKAEPGSLLELKARAGAAAFELTPVQIAEACNAFKRLNGTDMSLTEAVNYALKHSRPNAGVISVADAIEKAPASRS